MRMALGAARRLLGLRARGFRAALSDPDAAQAAVASRVAAGLVGTTFGRDHGISGASDLARVPPRSWEELQPWLSEVRVGERGVIGRDPVLFFETTSGSSGTHKQLPYTAGLRSVFTHLFVVWVHDVLAHGPPLVRGRCYFSVSPKLGEPEPGDADGIGDDLDYLDGWLRPLVAPFVVMPVRADERLAPDAFWDRLATGLLAADDLEVVSVWNPSFFTILLDRIEGDLGRYAAQLGGRRGAALRAGDWAAVWPRLRLLSCWGDAEAAPAADALGRRLPDVTVQPKGLLATEAPMTLPLIGSHGVPLVDAVLLELLDEAGELHPLHTAEVGTTYEIVLSVPGGLTRYRIGDRVVVTGHREATPCLRFAGRTGGVCDLVGEKLHPDLVADALDAVLPGRPFRTLVPCLRPRPHYALLLDAPAPDDVGAKLDTVLQRAHHYRQARLLGQLGPPRVLVDPELPAAYVAAQPGARLGDVKPRALVPRPGDAWLERFGV